MTWEQKWKREGFAVEWRDEVRQYVGLCMRDKCRGRREAMLFARKVTEMDKAIAEHRAKYHTRRKKR